MPGSQRDEKYSSLTAVIFLFNLVVGTGALTVPGALQKAGWFLGIFLLLILGVFSFITVTFIVESLAVANALARRCYGDTYSDQCQIEETPLVPRSCCHEASVFEITDKYEIGRMGTLLTPKWCQFLIYFCLCLYLFGDLAIYEVVIGKTFSEIICISSKANNSEGTPTNPLCIESSSITTMNVYRISIISFVFVTGPFVFFNLQKTKILQYFTSGMRWVAFFVMVAWNIEKLITCGVQGHPEMANFKAMPTLFGALVYSFMCQHSVPGLVTPVKHKDQIQGILVLDFVLATVFYLALAMTAVFTFPEVLELFTLNFWEEYTGTDVAWFPKMLAYYIVLYPVFSVTANFPILAITLRNNLRTLVLGDTPYAWYFDRLVFPLLTILPPTFLALTVCDVFLLVSIFGSYAGACVQYLIPCLLVKFARCHAQQFNAVNCYGSIFKGKCWIWAVFIWMVFSLVLITINLTASLF